MKSTIEKLSTLERKLNIEVPAAEVQAAFDRAFRGLQKQVAIKGFRKGKAPLATVRSVFGERVRQDVAQDLIQAKYAEALQKHELAPISYPTIEFDPLEDEKDFAFSAEFEVRPVVAGVQFEKLQVKRERANQDPSRADSVLEDIRKSRAETVAVLEDRPAQKGDVAVIDFEGSLLTGPLEGGSAQGHELELGSSSFIPGFEEAVEGMRVGQEKTISLTFPENYGAAEIAGKPVTFKTKLVALKKKQIPEMNDELVKKLGPYENVEALRAEILKDIDAREAKRIDDDARNRAMRALVDRNPVDVPKSLLNEQKKALIDDLQKRMKQQGLDDSMFDEYKKRWDSDFEQTATYMIRSSFLIDALAEEHKLHAVESDFDAKLQEYVKETGIELSKIRDFYLEPERKSRLGYQITEQKVIAMILSKADIREVSREELEAEASPAGN